MSPPEEKMITPDEKQLLVAVNGLFNSSTYSDLTITCGKDKYRVHKAIVCPQVPFFAGAMRFAAANKTNDSNVDLSEDDPAAVKALLEYLYKADYKPYVSRLPVKPHTCFDNDTDTDTDADGDGWRIPSWGYAEPHQPCVHHDCNPETCNFKCKDFVCFACSPPGEIPTAAPVDLAFHLHVYQLADMYHATGLKDLAKDKFAISCRQFWDTEEFMLAAESAVEVDKPLRDIVIATVGFHLELLDKEGFESLFQSNGELSMDVLKIRAETLRWKRPAKSEENKQKEVRVSKRGRVLKPRKSY
ncbi:hypothetical protein DM02DRAFT_686323 [Periconia macrospinosa]|uniref:BTB domain-containing protein n=1 Tax=Periconia macrospinosa TaxID=97972 RepID=A0A2V1E4A8_9PLEO|nr:hypothetical protein DM02DRAFT_686323 [Periconia macrospinosa]